ncbi:MAG: metal ABC transporter permease [Patescibacteria group bacterium]|nr:metal ABC transporter permease [Patescibacteria group bacterium]
MELLEMISYTFMQRAFMAGVILALLLASLGIFVTVRKMAFFGDGIAHSSLAGISIAMLAGLSPLPVALVWAVIIALLIWWLEKNTRLPSDTLIGISFTVSMALGVILMSFTKGYQPELVSFLFGSILAIRTIDLILIASLGAAILLWLALSFRQLTFMSLSEDQAAIAGVPVKLQTIVLYVALAMATVLGVKILGIILVSALLIIPPATSRLLTSTLRVHIIMSLVLGEIMVMSGLAISYLYDLPSGATVILIGTAMFTLAAIVRKRTA